VSEAFKHYAFISYGTRIVTTCYDQTARIWDVSKLNRPPIPVPERARAVAGLSMPTAR